MGNKHRKIKPTTPALATTQPQTKSPVRSTKPPLLLPPIAASLAKKSKRPSLLSHFAKGGFATIHAVFVALFILGLTINIQAMRDHAHYAHDTQVLDTHAIEEYRSLSNTATHLQAEAKEVNVPFDSQAINRKLAFIQVEMQVGKHHQARSEMLSLQKQFDGISTAIADARQSQKNRLASIATTAGTLPAESFNVPILLYHYTPGDFEAQLNYLSQHGYTVVSLDDLYNAFGHRTTLPSKPVILTFDDGFTNQLQAIDILKRHNMKATFYIVNGGEASRFCLGANRHNDTCGDSYLTWDQIRQIDRNPLFTVGSHTYDHLQLANLSPEDQRFQIINAKHDLEQQLGHAVTHFCYPYGSYNQTTINIVREAGFVTATTVTPGTQQFTNSPFTLRRIRTTLELP